METVDDTSKVEVRGSLILTLSLTIVIKFKSLLQPHQKYYITQYEELDFSSLIQMKDDCTTNLKLHHVYISP